MTFETENQSVANDTPVLTRPTPRSTYGRMPGDRFDRLAVMVVDDNRHMLNLIAEILRGLNIRDLVLMTDPKRAFKEFQTRPVDLIITEHLLQPIKGVELVKMIRNHPDSPDRYVPIIMVTDYSYLHTVTKARDAGVTEFLAKPISAMALYRRLLATINQPRPFIRCEEFFGPDRRRRSDKLLDSERRQIVPTECASDGVQLIPQRAA